MNRMLRKLRNKAKEKKGFTLIEMIIVIAIIAILIALIAPNLQKFLDTAKQTKADAAAKTLYTSVSTYLVDKYTQGGSGNISATWNSGTTTSPEFKEFQKDYLNENEIRDNVKYTIEIKSGKVISVVWEEDGLTGRYPRNSSGTASSPTPTT